MNKKLRSQWIDVNGCRMHARVSTAAKNETAPTMLVRGEKDPIVPQRWFDEAARLAHAKRTAVIAGWGHAVQYSAAQPLTDAIQSFLTDPS